MQAPHAISINPPLCAHYLGTQPAAAQVGRAAGQRRCLRGRNCPAAQEHDCFRQEEGAPEDLRDGETRVLGATSLNKALGISTSLTPHNRVHHPRKKIERIVTTQAAGLAT